MFKKPTRPQPKTTNIMNVKAALEKCASHRDINNNKLHSRSTFDFPQQKKQQRTLPIFDNLIDELEHSHSQLLFSTKGALKSIPKDCFNQSYSRGKLNIERDLNLPNLKKQANKSRFNDTNKRTSTQQDENKLNLTRMKVSDSKFNAQQILEENRKLRIINRHLEQQNASLIEALRKSQFREKSLSVQLRESNNCSEHTIIIQSLKRVIDSQLQKIIQLEREIIISGQQKQPQQLKDKLNKHKDKDKAFIEDFTPSFAPSSPKRIVLSQSNNSTEEDMNMYIEYVDTFRKDVKAKQNYSSSIAETKQKQPLSQLEINSNSNFADELLSEIDDCLDSLSRRKRQLL